MYIIDSHVPELGTGEEPSQARCGFNQCNWFLCLYRRSWTLGRKLQDHNMFQTAWNWIWKDWWMTLGSSSQPKCGSLIRERERIFVHSTTSCRQFCSHRGWSCASFFRWPTNDTRPKWLRSCTVYLGWQDIGFCRELFVGSPRPVHRWVYQKSQGNVSFGHAKRGRRPADLGPLKQNTLLQPLCISEIFSLEGFCAEQSEAQTQTITDLDFLRQIVWPHQIRSCQELPAACRAGGWTQQTKEASDASGVESVEWSGRNWIVSCMKLSPCDKRKWQGEMPLSNMNCSIFIHFPPLCLCTAGCRAQETFTWLEATACSS